jgi:hypothetical protein
VRLECLQHAGYGLFRCEAKHSEVLVLQIEVFVAILRDLLLLLMKRTIDFDDQPGARTEEISDVGPDRHLPREFPAVEALVS